MMDRRRLLPHRSTCLTSPLSNNRRNQLAFATPATAANAAPTVTPSTTPSPYLGAPPTIPLTALTPVERVVHVFTATTTNFVNGFLFGGIFGFVSGAWSKRSLKAAIAEAGGNGKSWAGISAVYAGLQTASKVIRRKDDRYNAIVGACGSGAAFSAKNGPSAAAQGCVTFAALSYFLDSLSSSNAPPANQTDEEILNKK